MEKKRKREEKKRKREDEKKKREEEKAAKRAEKERQVGACRVGVCWVGWGEVVWNRVGETGLHWMEHRWAGLARAFSQGCLARHVVWC